MLAILNIITIIYHMNSWMLFCWNRMHCLFYQHVCSSPLRVQNIDLNSNWMELEKQR